MIQNMDRQGGALMIEILVTLAIVVIGLWGLVELQTRLQASEVESYQRTHALLLLEDMANRIAVNQNDAADYVTASPLGAGMTCPTSSSTLQEADSAEWCNALQGASEQSGGNFAGTLIGGRGCVEDLTSNRYMVTVVWQGMTPVSAPPLSVACGQGLYNEPPGSDCVNDLCRRYVTTVVRIATL